MSKLVEWIVVIQLMQHINSNNLDDPLQSAYKSGHSMETTLLHIKNEIHLSQSQGEPTALVLLDLSGTFDTIDHTALLFSLYTIPLRKVIGMHPDIKYHFYADDTQWFIHMFHKNAVLDFDKLNSYLLDVQEWIL